MASTPSDRRRTDRRRRVIPAPPRVVIERIDPCVDGGHYPIKRTVGEAVDVVAVIHADGHDLLAAAVRHRARGERRWEEVPLCHAGNDRWHGRFTVTRLGGHEYTVEAWVDRFGTWSDALAKKVDAGQDVAVDLEAGALLVEEAVQGSPRREAAALRRAARRLRGESGEIMEERTALAVDPELRRQVAARAPRASLARREPVLNVTVEPERARFSAWYEMFPRSAAPEPGRHGTLRDVEARLPYVAEMGFDILYLPPIHPIGITGRKGRNNTLKPEPGDPGSPWAIGAAEGGHDAVHPQLGTVEDLRRLAARSREHGLDLALDLAFQCSPDHPWVREHPEWFRQRPDGSIQPAENPPKRYEDIYPLDFESEDWESLWAALRDVVRFWVDQGVRVFRVDNPHTKPHAFWEWLIREIRTDSPEVIFLAEAFTRPSVMFHLAKIGFSQSYDYFPWRNTAHEIRAYFHELETAGVREYFRPSHWPNTPDILTEYLQAGGRPAFLVRLVLAATLGASYGIYGPPFELGENAPLAPGREEYLDSEKYEIRHWHVEQAGSLREAVGRVNRIRRENAALHFDRSLRFHDTDNDQIVVFSKSSESPANLVVVAANLDFHHRQSGYVHLDLEALGIDSRHPFQAHDLLGGGRYLWHGGRNYLELDPGILPAQIFRIRRHVRTERDFDYFL